MYYIEYSGHNFLTNIAGRNVSVNNFVSFAVKRIKIITFTMR